MDAFPWVIGCIALPLIAALTSFLAGRRGAAVVGVIAAPIITAISAMLVWQTAVVGAHRHVTAGFGAPLSIELRVDGLGLLMVATTSVVGLLVSLYAHGYFQAPRDADDAARARIAHERRYFWPLWLLSWGALHALFLSADIFNLYVALELVGLSAVALVALAGPTAWAAAMRYLLVTLVGSMFYLFGVGLLYSAYATLDLTMLGARIASNPVTFAALALITSGMVLKTALFPLHFWLAPAHSSAPTPVSAVLSGLVIKASFYLMIRLWLDVFSPLVTPELTHGLALLAMGAIVWGSVQALVQTRLKLLVAYSTVAQLGYLFLFLPPAMHGAIDAWSGGIYYALSHACAKGAMFMAAGSFQRALGHDTITGLRGTGWAMRVSFFAFGLAGVSLMGLPPSGGFIGKWLIARAAIETQHWLIAVAVFGGGLLAAAYIFRVLAMAFVPSQGDGAVVVRQIPLSMQIAPMVLAMIAILLGLLAFIPLELLQFGDPFHSAKLAGGGP